MQTRKILVAWAVVVGLALAACTTTNTPNVTLNDTSWLLVNLNSQSVLSDTPVTIDFENGTISGTDGCNRYTTTYTLNGGKLSVDKNMVGTMAACPEPIMQQASAYTTALTQAATYKIDGQQLTLLDAVGKTLATFTKQSRELGGTSWIVTGYDNGKQAVVSVVVGSELTADFTADGKLSGSAGCNHYTATYEASGKSIKIGPAASTRKMCAEPAGVMEQETQYLKALEMATTYRLDGNQMELRTTDGALAATFVTSPTQSPQEGASILQALPNAEYPIEFTSTGKAQLKELQGITSMGVPPARYWHTAIWKGSEMIVWGGRDDGSTLGDDGARLRGYSSVYLPVCRMA
jgi:heat shock protein HslJ